MISYLELGRHGRLGNQLFQIAATLAWAHRHGQLPVFPAENPVVRYFDLLALSEAELSRHFWTRVHEPLHSPVGWPAAPRPAEGNSTLVGYFQSERYFITARAQVRSTFQGGQSVMDRARLRIRWGLQETPSVAAVHVRRGDYLHLPDHYARLGETDYYPRALDRLRANGVDRFIVFSDDIAWCERHLAGPGVEFSRDQNEFEDLMLMSLCTHHVMANSSFSWWGSWLSESRLTFAPSRWFGPAVTYPAEPIYREDMLRI